MASAAKIALISSNVAGVNSIFSAFFIGKRIFLTNLHLFVLENKFLGDFLVLY